MGRHEPRGTARLRATGGAARAQHRPARKTPRREARRDAGKMPRLDQSSPHASRAGPRELPRDPGSPRCKRFAVNCSRARVSVSGGAEVDGDAKCGGEPAGGHRDRPGGPHDPGWALGRDSLGTGRARASFKK